jgi:hypothetical protein
MQDEVYRPQKKSISPAELNDDAESLRGYEPGMPEEGGIQFSGNIPPQLRDMVEAKQVSQKLSRPNIDGVYTDRTGGSDKFRMLMEQINSKTSKHEKIQLPSKGRFYDGTDGPVNGVIHVRKMTGEEEELLATPNLVKKGQAMNMIFNNCMEERYKAENFLTQDRVHMLIFLRGISYSTDYDVEIRCPECSAKFDSAVDLDAFMVDLCPDDFNEDSLKEVLPITGIEFTYRLARGVDEQEIQNYKDMRLKGFNGAASDDTLHYRTAQLINELGGVTDKDELKKLLQKLPIGDVAFLRDVVSNPPFGVNTKFGLDCPRCLASFETELQLEANFFFPKGRKKKQA